eukprot:scpid61135/ scgid17610/ GDP-fucose protein O-fucosyltransferase 1; Peptide-O-fucosyltransferase 1
MASTTRSRSNELNLKWLVLAISAISSAGVTVSEEEGTTVQNQPAAVEWDSNGYLSFCLCMGRFGNQAAHFLGGLAMAKRINRTLILPPWNDGHLVQFEQWFKVEAVSQYHRVITASDFMEKLAPANWPPEKRVGMCFSFPGGSSPPCVMDDSDHHFWYWRAQGIKFVRTEQYYLSYNAEIADTKREWDERFPADKYPVLALRGAPAGFPMTKKNNALHEHLVWSDAIASERDRLIAEHLPAGGKFVGIHIRNAQDWVNTCNMVDTARGSSLMASPQCVGYEAGTGTVTKDMCLPSRHSIAQHTAEAVSKIGANAVYVATADDPMLDDLRSALGSSVKVVALKPRPQLDLALLAQADHFIGNCVSSFSAFVRQERDANGKSSSFFNHGRSHLSPIVHEDL